MIGGVIVTHGLLGQELLNAVKGIVGKISCLESVSIGWEDDVDEGKGKINKALKEVDRGSGVVLFTDKFGGTPSNMAFSFLEKGKVEVITGTNLPMLLKFTFVQKSTDLADVARSVYEDGKNSIYLASRIYEKQQEER